MKGVSDIIAMLLMLVITIAIAGLAYAFITGVFTARTAVQLSLDPQSTTCDSTSFHLYIRNDGTSASGQATITITAPDGNNALSAGCTINNVPAMSTSDVSCSRQGGKPAGGYTVRITAPGAPSYVTTYYCGVPS